jgi:hypothetical protein
MSESSEIQADPDQHEISASRHLESNSEQFFPDRSRDGVGEAHATRASQDIPPLNFGISTQSRPTSQTASQVDSSQLNRSVSTPPPPFFCIDIFAVMIPVDQWLIPFELTE